MKKVLVIVGYGPGISSAVAEKFGKEGFSVALVARNKERLEKGVGALKAKGVDAASFVADAANPSSIKEAIDSVHKAMGPITALQWSAYSMAGGDFTTAPASELHTIFDIPVVGLLSAVQASLADVKAQKGAYLITNGGFGLLDAQMEQAAVSIPAMGMAVGNAAKHKLVRVLNAKLKGDGVFVGEIMVCGAVKGTAFDNGSATIEASKVGEAFWKLWTARSEMSVNVM